MHTLRLRGSGQFEIQAVMNSEIDSGVEHGVWLTQLVDATIQRRWDDVAKLREDGVRRLDAERMVDVLSVAAAFNGITRIADATGIPLDSQPAKATATMRESLRIDDFEYQEKSRRYDRVEI